MKTRATHLQCFAAACALLAASVSPAYGQAAKASISGTVADPTGGLIPGATVDVKHNATGVSTVVITNSAGAFVVPSLDPGTYTVTVSLSGFKTAVVKDQVLVVGNPASLRITLEVGNLEQTVEVRGGSELIQTQSTAVSSTINATQIANLPLSVSNVLYGFVTLLPGVDTIGAPRDSKLFGLPEEAIKITIDGVNSQNNWQRGTDGFFSMITPNIDALEQVTLTGAAAGADSATGGSVAIKFVTRSGTNQYRGSVYHYFRHPDLNTNYYFNEVNNLPRNPIKLNQFGGNEGGPIKIPRLFDGSGRAFFFVNFEEYRQPSSSTVTRTIIHPRTQAGIFRYNVTSGGVTTTQEVDVLALAGQNGQLSTPNATVVALLANVRALSEATVAEGIGVISDQNNVNQQQLLYQTRETRVQHRPTFKIDVNLSAANRLSGSYWLQEFDYSGTANFPGLRNTDAYWSYRTVGSVSLRSTLSSRIVNELQGGWQWSPGTFNYGVDATHFDNQSGFNLSLPLGLTQATRSANPNTRNQSNIDIKNTVSWLKGAHSLSFGGGFMRVGQHIDSKVVVPSISFGVQTGLDPADAMFTTSNFPGASTANLDNARALYGLLTGRVTSLGGTAWLNEKTDTYEYLGFDNVRARQDEFNLFLQDSWRWRPNVTVNFGLAWVVGLPIVAGNNSYSTIDYAGFCGPYGIGADGRCRLFQVGGDPTAGKVPEFVQYTASTKGYNTDANNVAPNIGVSWRPNVQGGWLRQLLGDPELATVRAGFSVGFNQPSIGDFTDLYGANPGRSTPATRNNTNSNYLLVPAGEAWPVLLTETNRLGPPSGLPERPAFPIRATTGTSIAIFDAGIEMPYTRSFSVGFQRALGREMAVEFRYVGTRGLKGWTGEDWNQTNVIDNGFFEEFKRAQANLRSAVEQGLCATQATCTFGYRGPGSGTSPLPIYLAYLTGSGDANNPAAYSTPAAIALFTNTTFQGRFDIYQPSVMTSANTDLQTTARRANAIAAGLPANFFRMNPAIGTSSAELTVSNTRSRYDSAVIDLRRRLSRGLLFTASFTATWQQSDTRNGNDLHNPRIWIDNTSGVPKSLKLTANYEVPVGRGKRFLTDTNPWLNGALGGWSLNMTGRVQTGRVLTVTGAQLVGMSEDELNDMYELRKDPATGIIYMLPDDIILNTRRAYSTSPTSLTGYGSLGAPEGRYIAPASGPDCVQLYAGDCGPRNIYVRGPMFTRFDMNMKKTFPFGKRNVQVQLDALNLFDAINFNPVFNPGSGGGIFQVNSAYTDTGGTFDPGGRLMQIVWRVNW
jgi:hypothetical protein